MEGDFTRVILGKHSRGRPADRGHAVLGVIGVTSGAAFDLLRHVPQLLDSTDLCLLPVKTVSTRLPAFRPGNGQKVINSL